MSDPSLEHGAIRFDFGLATDAPGWADPVLVVGDRRIEMTASYLRDALGGLLHSLIDLVNGAPCCRCEWDEEPGEWVWAFSDRKDETVRLQVLHRADHRRPGPTEAGEVRVDVRIRLRDVIHAVVAGARRCLDEFGREGYAEQWLEHPFPALQLEALERWLDRGEPAPVYDFDDR